MTYVNNESVDCAVDEICDLFRSWDKMYELTDDEKMKILSEDVRTIIGRYLGIRTEDGKDRFYDVILLEGEPYVMDE